MPLAVQEHLCEGFAYGDLPVRKVLRLQYSCQIRLRELIEPGKFLLLRSLEPLDDLFESFRNDALSFDRERESLAEVNPVAMRYQNVMNELP